MRLPNQENIELVAQFPSKTVLLDQQTSVEAHITVTNHSDDSVSIEFNSGQTFDIYLYDEQDILMNQWSADRMFTQALHSIEIKPGTSERFGGELALVNQADELLALGNYRLRIEIKGILNVKNRALTEASLSSQTSLELGKTR